MCPMYNKLEAAITKDNEEYLNDGNPEVGQDIFEPMYRSALRLTIQKRLWGHLRQGRTPC
jgi:hypothetical protein